MGKNLKDENAPPRPLTAYFAWMKVNRTEVKAANPGIKNKELTKKLGEKWSSCSDEDKKPFIDTAKTQMDEWKAKMEVYKKTDDYKEFLIRKRQFDAKKKQKTKGKKKAKPPKDPNQPKRPSTGFFLFVEEKRAEVKASLPPEQRNKVTIITKKCGLMWKAEENAEMKAEYQARAAKLKAKWDEDMAAYKKTEQFREYQAQVEEWKEDQEDKKRKVIKRNSRKLSSEDSDTDESS